MKLIVLDRDGVINEDSDAYIKGPDEWVPVAGSLQAIRLLTENGYTVVVATNQSGLGRGLFDEFTLAQIHQLMCSMVEEAGGRLAGIFFCPHHPDENCACRKPATGLIQQIESEFAGSVRGAPLIGDSEKDLDLAMAAGCEPILVLSGKGKLTLAALSEEKRNKIRIFDNLLQAAKALCQPI